MFIGEAIGPFKVERELGSGAMGTVYRCLFQRDDGREQTIALKIVALGLLGNEGAMARFEREAEILKQLRHPNIVRLVATGRYKKTPFIAMEFVDGEPMDRMLTRRGRLGWEEVVGYMKQLCLALHYAHEKGIIHRDLKPSNLMITENGVLKLTDFGIAKDQDVTALTGANSTIGTAAYMSPEQCKGDKHLTGKCDLYSLGVVMYELITGRKPFTAETTVDMFLKHVHEKPVRPSRLVPDLPIWLETLMMHLLEKDKDKRPLDAATVGRMFDEIEQKVAAQESAGAAVANARRIDRPLGEAALDETDKEAARTLRDTKGGKRKKKKKEASTGVPVWLKILPPIAGLLLIAVALYFVFKPEGMEKQFAKVAAAGTPDDKIQLANEFLQKFGKEGGEQVEKAKAILAEARGQKIEAVIEKRFHSKAMRNVRDKEKEDETAYELSWTAMEGEQKGDVTRAAELWAKVKARAPEVKDAYGDGWGWLADRHLADIRQADDLVNTLRKEIADREIYESVWTHDVLDPKSLATVAIRLGGAGGPKPVGEAATIPFLKDDAKTAKAWSDLADAANAKPEKRAWFILGARERKFFAEVKPDAALARRKAEMPAQLERIRKEWTRVANDANLGANQRDCRNRARDLVELFADETDADLKTTVDDAKKLLAEMAKK